jgi:hypothetical protein
VPLFRKYTRALTFENAWCSEYVEIEVSDGVKARAVRWQLGQNLRELAHQVCCTGGGGGEFSDMSQCFDFGTSRDATFDFGTSEDATLNSKTLQDVTQLDASERKRRRGGGEWSKEGSGKGVGEIGGNRESAGARGGVGEIAAAQREIAAAHASGSTCSQFVHRLLEAAEHEVRDAEHAVRNASRRPGHDPNSSGDFRDEGEVAGIVGSALSNGSTARAPRYMPASLRHEYLGEVDAALQYYYFDDSYASDYRYYGPQQLQVCVANVLLMCCQCVANGPQQLQVPSISSKYVSI